MCRGFKSLLRYHTSLVRTEDIGNKTYLRHGGLHPFGETAVTVLPAVTCVWCLLPGFAGEKITRRLVGRGTTRVWKSIRPRRRVVPWHGSRFAVYRLPAGHFEAILRSDPGCAVRREVRLATLNLDLEALAVAPYLD